MQTQTLYKSVVESKYIHSNTVLKYNSEALIWVILEANIALCFFTSQHIFHNCFYKLLYRLRLKNMMSIKLNALLTIKHVAPNLCGLWPLTKKHCTWGSLPHLVVYELLELLPNRHFFPLNLSDSFISITAQMNPIFTKQQRWVKSPKYSNSVVQQNVPSSSLKAPLIISWTIRLILGVRPPGWESLD